MSLHQRIASNTCRPAVARARLDEYEAFRAGARHLIVNGTGTVAWPHSTVRRRSAGPEIVVPHRVAPGLRDIGHSWDDKYQEIEADPLIEIWPNDKGDALEFDRAGMPIPLHTSLWDDRGVTTLEIEDLRGRRPYYCALSIREGPRTERRTDDPFAMTIHNVGEGLAVEGELLVPAGQMQIQGLPEDRLVEVHRIEFPSAEGGWEGVLQISHQNPDCSGKGDFQEAIRYPVRPQSPQRVPSLKPKAREEDPRVGG